jgi:Uma2 family endonuclease
MSTTAVPDDVDVVYPDSDGEPMAENTVQYEWIVTLKGNLDILFADRPDVFVAGDNLIYPVRGDNKTRQAPDVYVAFGRPKGHRGSYKVWEEGGVFPQVVFEVWSPGNRAGDMLKRRKFYRKYGAEEYYVLDPDSGTVEGWLRQGRRFDEIEDTNGFVSPRLGIRFDTSGPEVVISFPNGERFLTFQQLGEARVAAEARAEAERARADAAAAEADRLRALLRAAGIDPDAAPPG